MDMQVYLIRVVYMNYHRTLLIWRTPTISLSFPIYKHMHSFPFQTVCHGHKSYTIHNRHTNTIHNRHTMLSITSVGITNLEQKQAYSLSFMYYSYGVNIKCHETNATFYANRYQNTADG